LPAYVEHIAIASGSAFKSAMKSRLLRQIRTRIRKQSGRQAEQSSDLLVIKNVIEPDYRTLGPIHVKHRVRSISIGIVSDFIRATRFGIRVLMSLRDKSPVFASGLSKI
jgi:hypothetical protein